MKINNKIVSKDNFYCIWTKYSAPLCLIKPITFRFPDKLAYKRISRRPTCNYATGAIYDSSQSFIQNTFIYSYLHNYEMFEYKRQVDGLVLHLRT